MLKNTNIQSLIQESFDALYSAGFIEERISASLNENIFGLNSQLDSMSFVTFMTELEDRISQKRQKDIFIVLSDLDEIFPNQTSLTVEMLIKYINMLLDSDSE